MMEPVLKGTCFTYVETSRQFRPKIKKFLQCYLHIAASTANEATRSVRPMHIKNKRQSFS